jgi:hypothetical protein
MNIPSTRELLPFGMHVAAMTTALDNIKIELVSEPIDISWSVYIHPDDHKNYEHVLAKKLSNIINENIIRELNKNPEVKLYIYMFAQMVKDGNMVGAISKCEIK